MSSAGPPGAASPSLGGVDAEASIESVHSFDGRGLGSVLPAKSQKSSKQSTAKGKTLPPGGGKIHFQPFSPAAAGAPGGDPFGGPGSVATGPATGLAAFLSRSLSRSRLFPSGQFSPIPHGGPAGGSPDSKAKGSAASSSVPIGAGGKSGKAGPGAGSVNMSVREGPQTVETQGWALAPDERRRVLTVWDPAFMKVVLVPRPLR